MDNNLTDCIKELRVARNKQYDADFEDNSKDYAYYKGMADYYQELFDNGQEFNVNF